MKKLVATIGILSMVVLSVSAQYGRAYDRDNYGEKYGRVERNDRNGGSWGYDKDWNVVNNSKVHKINSFQHQAKMRINEGIAKGLITHREANRLWNEYERIERKENRFMRNGRISRSEANELEHDLARLNRMISQEKRDFNRNYSGRF
ncbi:MAG: hypothetical protein IPH28_11560 [Cytophagaceae bacterium]|nr:hypothetical protein [Cytophagaceae bacterium]